MLILSMYFEAALLDFKVKQQLLFKPRKTTKLLAFLYQNSIEIRDKDRFCISVTGIRGITKHSSI